MIRLKVKEVAQEKGFTQGKLSRASDTDPKTISRIFRNPYTEVTTTTLDRIALALDVDVRELLESVKEPKEEDSDTL